MWPWWLERQLDPLSPAFVARGDVPTVANLTGVNWTTLGNVGSPWRAVVDPRGLVTPTLGGWSLDWWVGAPDRWHLPSREASVRQSRVGSSPVVQTLMGLAGGDVACTVYAVAHIAGFRDLLVVEFDNRCRSPVAVAFAVRPYNASGLAFVERIELAGDTVVVDGGRGVLLPRPPSFTAWSPFAAGDVIEAVEAGGTGSDGYSVGCADGLAQAAFVFPVPHATSIRVALPLVPHRPGARRRRRVGVSAGPPPAGCAPGADAPGRAAGVALGLPAIGDAVRAWDVHARRGLRLALPPGVVADAVEASRRALLLMAGRLAGDADSGDEPGTVSGFERAAEVVEALDRFDLPEEAASVLVTYPERQRADGSFHGDGGATGAALAALGTHWRLTRDRAVLDATRQTVARAAEFIERSQQGAAAGRLTAGLVPGGADHRYGDDMWSWRGLLDAAELLRAGAQEEPAQRAEEQAAYLGTELRSSFEHLAASTAGTAIRAGPYRRFDGGALAVLAGCEPLRLLDPSDPGVVATAQALRQRFVVGAAVHQYRGPTGLGTHASARLARVELAAGDGRALDRLRWLAGAGGPVFSWPEVVHPWLGTGCGGEGDDAGAAAGLLCLVRDVMVREVPAGVGSAPGLALWPLLPAEWRGTGLEVHGAPTGLGRLSFAVRWHGERPALLWELTPHDGVGAVTLSAPGLDARWSTEERAGEDLLCR